MSGMKMRISSADYSFVISRYKGEKKEEGSHEG